ncbi:complexin-1 isoform X2 [Rhinolophus sinicus]|uniref:complexin-1 isoform X2 n=1 Tax=Rhinolophus sinicus TaxID=89399 RepID=UPI003D7BEE2D
MEFVMKQALGGATKDMGKMLGGDEEKDPDAAKKEEERQEALRQEEEERKAKYAKMEAEREAMRQGIRDKESNHYSLTGGWVGDTGNRSHTIYNLLSASLPANQPHLLAAIRRANCNLCLPGPHNQHLLA